MSERQQPDHGAARLLLAVTGQQRFEGAPVGATREELFTIDQVEQGHWLAAQGMDDVSVIDHMTVLAVGVEATRGAASSVASRRESIRGDRRRAARAADGRSSARAPNRTLSSGVKPLVEVTVTIVSL